MHDWSRLHYGGHASKKDRLQMTHAKDIGDELQSSLLVNAQNGLPLSVVAQNLVSAEGIWQSRKAAMRTDDQSHLDEHSERIDWIEQQQFSRRLVHLLDREADSVEPLRQWRRQGHCWLVRAKAGSMVRAAQAEIALAAVAAHLSFQQTGAGKSSRSSSCSKVLGTSWRAGSRKRRERLLTAF